MLSIGWLYLIPTLIWGSTWIVILGQLGTVSPEVSVFYRFVIASMVAFLYAYYRKSIFLFKKRDHLWFALQGVCNFSLNYILTYYSEQHITTGLVAVIFSLLPYFNTIGAYIFYKEKLNLKSIIALVCGGLGIFLIFKDKIHINEAASLGFILAFIGTMFSSSGNLISVRLHKMKIPVTASLPWAMFYGALFSLITSVLTQKDFIWDYNPNFLLSLLYLSIFGTFVAFIFYFELIKRVGAAKAAYTSTMIPVIALILSFFYEGFQWNTLVLVGLLFAIAGQILMLQKKRASA